MRLEKIKCKNCQKLFAPKSPKNIYDSRRCFKKAYYHQKKAEELRNIKFPVFLCPNCNVRIELSFDPIKEYKKWVSFSCPKCSVLFINVCENIGMQDSPVTS